MEVWLVRHGEAETNLTNKDFIAGRSNWAELTPLGIMQSCSLRPFLNNISFDKVFCSPAVRAQATARYAISKKPILVPQILEINLGSWEGMPRNKVYTKSLLKKLKKDEWRFLPPHGESQEQVFKRTYEFLIKELSSLSDNSRIICFTHGYVIKFLLAGLSLVSKNGVFRLPIANSSITILSYNDGVFSLKLKNNTDHLLKLNISSRPGIYEKEG